jgi:hypothetical protein
MWPRIVNIALGLWLMVAPSVLDYGDPAAANDRIVGPIAAALAVIAVWEATRPLRWVNVVLGLWLVIAPWPLGYPADATLNSTAVGVLLTGLALVPGRYKERLGGGWSAIWAPSPASHKQ